MSNEQMEQMMDDMVDFTAESISKEEETAKRVQFRETLSKVNNMLSSKEFTRKCKDQAKQYGVNINFIKNKYAANILDKMGVSCTLIVELAGEVFNYLCRLVSYVLQKIMDIAVSALVKFINIITFRREVA